MADRKEAHEYGYVEVIHVKGYSDQSFAAATKDAVDKLYRRVEDRGDMPMSFEVVSLGGTITPNPGKINYASEIAVTVGGG